VHLPGIPMRGALKFEFPCRHFAMLPNRATLPLFGPPAASPVSGAGAAEGNGRCGGGFNKYVDEPIMRLCKMPSKAWPLMRYRTAPYAVLTQRIGIFLHEALNLKQMRQFNNVSFSALHMKL
jgi:hypothetical protein